MSGGNPQTAVITRRAEQLYDQQRLALAKRIDRMFAWLLMGQWLFGIAIAVFFSPYGWTTYGESVKRQHLGWAGFDIATFNLAVAVVLGGLISSLPVILAWRCPGQAVTRYVISCAQICWSALLIHLTGGRIETHFHVFGSLAFIAFYREWKLLLPATAIVAADHLMRGLFWPESVYGMLLPEWWRFLEHVFWVVFEDVFLTIAIVGGVRELRTLCAQRARVEVTERLEKEMQIASQIQTSLLPATIEVPGLEASARMLPATEVGGDYYDVIPAKDGCWIAMGDVAGHGLPAGLVMLQAQSALASLVRQDPDARPGRVLGGINNVLFENIRHRLKSDEHMTISLLRFRDDGQLIFAGAHEEIVVCRAADGRCIALPTRGAWLGAMKDVEAHMVESEYRLDPGDVVILYTDGLTEAMNASGEQFGLEHLFPIVEQNRALPADRLRDLILSDVQKWTEKQDDDVTLMVLRFVGAGVGAAATGARLSGATP